MDIEVNFSKADKSFAAEVSADERSHEVNADGELVFYVPQLDAYLKREDAEKYYQPKGEYLESSELEGAINDALREAQESGQFNGEPGYTPVKGKDYFDGKPGAPGNDGITPHIGSNGNWFIGDTDTGILSRGEDGYTPVKGKDYFDGEPGYSPVKGKDYFDGAPGRTPEKGVDYWTSDDIEEMVAATVAALPKYNGEVIEL